MAMSAPEHPSMQNLLGSPDAEILKLVKQFYWGELAFAPSVLLCTQQDMCTRKLSWELNRHMARASLQSETRMA